MIKFSELKPNNYVKCRKSNDAGIYKVCAMDALSLQVMLNGVRDGTWYKEEDVRPIPISEEWLDNFGFEPYEDSTGMWQNKVFRKFKLGIEQKKKNLFSVIWYDANDDYGTTMYVELKYIHQLQNIYFTLTGGEIQS